MYEEILKIRQDEYERNRFIERYKPFLAKYTSSICKRYVSYGHDEELSVALLAFNESIDRFQGEGIFFEYAKIVVRSRLYDYFHSKEYKERHVYHDIDDEQQYYMNDHSQSQYYEELKNNQLKEEVEELKKLLSFYSIEMIDLYESRPKHLMSKKHVHHVIKKILDDDETVSFIIDKGYLPMKRILDLCHTTKKRLEPYRRYIIAVVMICEGQFELLKAYMPREVMKE